jgi:hydroxymethylglutaryl-CoA synthase
MDVGIEALAVSFPQTCVELADLAVARGVAPSKYLDGIGTRRMAVPLADEDTVTLAARAAAEVLARSGTHPDTIGLLVVGTETAVDHSKPVASYVQGLVGIGPRCRVFETKHACYGGTAALQLALDWIRSGSAGNQKALVICADIARYGLRTPGEPTQGAGAVALLLSSTPRLLSIDAASSGLASLDVHDFWRPLYSKDAFVDGQYSVQCYLDALSGAYQHHRERVGATGRHSDRFAAIAYHVPYGKMARKAHRQLRQLDADPTPDASFDAQVAPGLILPSEIGNIYTGSLYLALASLLEYAPDLGGRSIGLFSYGSGNCAEFFTGTVGPEAQAWVRALALPARLAARRVLTLPEYEAVMDARESLDTRTASDVAGGPGPEFAFLGVRGDRRTYRAR